MKITSVKQQTKNQQRFSIYVDGDYSFSLSESQLLETGVHTGMELDAEKLAELKSQSDFGKVVDRTFNLLSYRPRSEWEIRMYLQKHKQPSSIIERVVEMLRNKKYIDDEDFARRWVEAKRRGKPVSTLKLRQQLKQKRIEDSIISEVLSDGHDEKNDLRELVTKKQHRYPDQQKFMRYLAGQGFRYDDIKSVLSEEDET